MWSSGPLLFFCLSITLRIPLSIPVIHKILSSRIRVERDTFPILYKYTKIFFLFSYSLSLSLSVLLFFSLSVLLFLSHLFLLYDLRLLSSALFVLILRQC